MTSLAGPLQVMARFVSYCHMWDIHGLCLLRFESELAHRSLLALFLPSEGSRRGLLVPLPPGENASAERKETYPWNAGARAREREVRGPTNRAPPVS